MYGASRLSPIGRAFYTFVGISILMLMFTWLTFRVRRVVTAGVCATGQIVGISHCHGRDNKVLATVNLDVAFTNTGRAQQAAKAASAALRTRAFTRQGGEILARSHSPRCHTAYAALSAALAVRSGDAPAHVRWLKSQRGTRRGDG